MPPRPGYVRRLLWVDASAAALAGAVVLSLGGWLSGVHGLPRGLLAVVGGVNLAYAAFSFSLAVRARRPESLIRLLVAANAAWAVACVGLAAAFAASATPFGLTHLVGEGAFVACLAALEWRWRDALLTAA